MITLKDYSSKILNGIRDAIGRFKQENGEFSAMGIYSCPWVGWVMVCFDKTKELSDDNNCPDFEFVEYEMIEIPDWGEEYEQEHPRIKINALTVKKHHHEDGDDEYNKIFFDYLRVLIKKNFLPEYRGKIFLQMLDSCYEEVFR